MAEVSAFEVLVLGIVQRLRSQGVSETTIVKALATQAPKTLAATAGGGGGEKGACYYYIGKDQYCEVLYPNECGQIPGSQHFPGQPCNGAPAEQPASSS